MQSDAGADDGKLVKWLTYFKVSLADLELGRGVFSPRQVQALDASVLSSERIRDQQINEGEAWFHGGGDHQVLTLSVLKDWMERDPKAVITDEWGRWIQCVVYPYVYLLEKRHQHGQARRQFAPQMVAPVSFTVRLYEDGRLVCEGRPGVPRDLLEPSNGARPFAIGSVDDLDAFFDANPFPEWKEPTQVRWSLEQVMAYCETMLEAIRCVDMRAPMGDSGPGYIALDEPLIHRGRADDGAIRPLLTSMTA